MRTIFFYHFVLTREQRSGFFILMLILLATFAVKEYIPEAEPEIQRFSQEEIRAFEKSKPSETPNLTAAIHHSQFNPNELDVQGFEKLGFSKKQAQSLIKYRYSLGGNFKNIEEFGAAYVISEKKMKELKPFIQLKIIHKNKVNIPPTKHSKKEKIQLQAFDPNRYTARQWQKIGFSERQAATIIKYKNTVCSGQFTSLAQIKKCYVISDDKFSQIQPYIRLKTEKNKPQEKPKLASKFNPNDLTSEQWESLGFSEDEAGKILKYRDFIGGFSSKEEVKKCKVISIEQFNKIKDRLKF